MTFTYALADLTATSSSGSLAKIRLRVGDTNSADVLLADEEIYYYLTAEGSVSSASIAACEAIIAGFARYTDKTVGPFSESLSQRIASYVTLLARLKSAASGDAIPYAGGISIAAKDANIAQADRVAPAFYTGMLTNPDRGESGSRADNYNDDSGAL